MSPIVIGRLTLSIVGIVIGTAVAMALSIALNPPATVAFLIGSAGGIGGLLVARLLMMRAYL